MSLIFKEGNPSKKGKPSIQGTLFFGFVAHMERKNPKLVHLALNESKRKVEEFCRHQNLTLSVEAMEELEGAFNSWFFCGLMEGQYPGSFQP